MAQTDEVVLEVKLHKESIDILDRYKALLESGCPKAEVDYSFVIEYLLLKVGDYR